MLGQLLLSKRLFHEGVTYACRTDSFSCGLAISLFQDAVEMYVWALIKDRGISVKETSSFIANIDALEKAGIEFPYRAKIIELNKARVGFKHYGNLPASDDAKKFEIYTEDFLRTSTVDHFKQSFDELSLVDLISFVNVRSHLKAAETAIAGSEFAQAIQQIAIAKVLLFHKLEFHVPSVDKKLGDMDRVLGRAATAPGFDGFKYITQYLGILREISLVILMGIPITDYTYLRSTLPSAYRFGDGRWQVNMHPIEPTEEQCRRAIGILVEISIQLERTI